MEKNDTASSIKAIQRRMKPMPTIVRIAPIRVMVPVVANMRTRVLSERVVSDLRRKIAVIIMNTKSSTRLRTMYVT